MIRVLSIALAAACAAACSPSQPAASAPAKATPAAAVTAAAPAAAAPSAESARAWVVGLYAGYADDQFSPFATPENWFAPDLVAALAEDERLTPDGEMGAIDADPVCSCQDPTDMKATVGEITVTGAGKARVKVKLQWPLLPNPIPDQIPDYTRNQTLQLVMTGAGWRIADIGEGSDSFLNYLKRENAAARSGRRAQSSDEP